MPSSLLPEVEKALKHLEEAQIVRESEEGFKLLTMQEKHWDHTRRGLDPSLLSAIGLNVSCFRRYLPTHPSAVTGTKTANRFSVALIDGEVVESSGQLPLSPDCR
jgi:hypothetical protein